MADASDFFTNLAKHLGGAKTTGGDATVDLQTGEIKYNPATAKHPFLSRVSGKADEIQKLNEMMQLLQTQQNAKVGGQRLLHAQGEETANNNINRDLLKSTAQPVNPQTQKMIQEMAANPAIIKMLQESVGAGAMASTAGSKATASEADLKKRVAALRLIDTFRNPNKTVEKDDRAFESGVMKDVGRGALGITPLGYEEGFAPVATGGYSTSTPITQTFGGQTYDTGKSRETEHPGSVFVSPNRMAEVQMGRTRMNPNPNFNPSALQPNPTQYPQGIGPAVQPTEHRLDPTSLGIKTTGTPVQGGSLGSAGSSIADLLRRISALYPQGAVGAQ